MFWDIIIIIFSVLIVGAVIVRSIIRKKQGKSSCGCDCANCSSCSYCQNEKNTD